MSSHMSRVVPVWGILVLFTSASTASAQWYPFGTSCSCVQPVPVVQSCYQTVPVTEYRQVQQTVQRPVYETKYVDQQVTAYRPVTETRTVDVPTVSYENVTEMHTVMRDCGHWTTQYQCNPKLTPCQYDNRPTLFGWLNRSGYAIRSAFTPNYFVRRQYVPNMVAQQVPVTRLVARQGTRKVTYNVTRMVPYTTTHKVAVNTVRYVSEKIITQRPMTVWRTLPIGTSVAHTFAPYGIAPTQTALQPSPDPVSVRENRSKRTATNRSDYDEKEKFSPKRYKRDSSNHDFDSESSSQVPIRKSSLRVPQRRAARGTFPQARRSNSLFRSASGSLPSMVRVARWTTYGRSAPSTGPSLISPGVSIAGAAR